MKYWETEHTISLPWVEVSCCYWWRYPNPYSKHVFSVDMLDSRVEGDKLYARRLIMKTNPLPSWGKHFFAARRVAVIEEVEVNRGNQELVWYTRNIGLVSFMATVERVTLKEKDTITQVRKQCWIDSSIFGFRSAIKKFGVDRYKKNCGPATLGLQMVVEEKLAKDKISKAVLLCGCESTSCQCGADFTTKGQVQGQRSQICETTLINESQSQGHIYKAVKKSFCDSGQGQIT